jgi:transposase-like protein
MLLSMHSVISGLYNDGYSSREIEKILLKRYKKEISHTYVNTYIKEYVSDKEN